MFLLRKGKRMNEWGVKQKMRNSLREQESDLLQERVKI
jgi:hypothetical protein